MKVIHVTPAISKESSGPSYSVVRLCEALIEQGETVSLAALDWGEMIGKPNFLKLFPIGFGPKRLGRSPAMLRWLHAQASAGKVDVIHSHGMWQLNTVYPGWAAKTASMQFVVSPRGMLSEWAMTHGSWTKKVFWPALQRPALKYATCFHVTAASESEDVRRLGFHQPVAIIPNGIDIPEPTTAKLPGMPRTLLFLGRLHPKKGLDMLLPAWGAVQDQYPGWKLVIAGSDLTYYGQSGYLNQLQNLAKKLGLKRVDFAGELLGAAKQQAYRDADLFVLPTYSENFGLTVAEALAAGTPSIVTKGAPWAGLNDHRAGWWANVGIEPLTACLRAALGASSDELQGMGQRGRKWMETDFSWANVGRQMDETYKWLADRNRPVPTWVRTN